MAAALPTRAGRGNDHGAPPVHRPMSTSPPPEPLLRQLETFIQNSTFPCVGAKSALARGRLHAAVARDIRFDADDREIHRALLGFAKTGATDARPFRGFAVLFRQPRSLDEARFEAALWRRLQSLADIDAAQGHFHDPTVSADPSSPDFSVSFGGRAYFVVGLHPGASRPARRFAAPAVVFNPREQFTRLRADGLYEQLRTKIIARDIALAGDANPMLARHGEISEARQYSGRRVRGGWRCPFAPPARAA